MQLSQSNRRVLDKHANSLAERLKRAPSQQQQPVIGGGQLQYEVSARVRAINCGGIGVVQQLARHVGLPQAIDRRLHLLKRHQPYHESDHVLAVAYNVLCGGSRLEDLELLRQDEPLLEALGAARLPDPTTAGDFTRRFGEADVLTLMECINDVRQRVWALHGAGTVGDAPQATAGDAPRAAAHRLAFAEAVLDIDGTIAGTLGECKEGMALSYKGIWGYAPLLVSLANTQEPLYLANRPGNVPSQSEAAVWIERAVQLVKPHSERVCLRGDTAFALTAEFDGWSARGVDFVFGMDAQPNLVRLAEALPAAAWQELERTAKYEVATVERGRRERVKERIVRERGYKNLRLRCEDVAEFWYRPGKCRREYRVIALRKNLSVERGETVLFEDIRYFFYITNRTDLSAAEVVRYINERGDQENLIAQLKNGVHAMTMPVGDLVSNWAYMVMAALAWSLKAWCGLLLPDRPAGAALWKLEFRRFLQRYIWVPCQIVRRGRRLIYRVLGYNRWLGEWLALARWLQSRPQRC